MQMPQTRRRHILKYGMTLIENIVTPPRNLLPPLSSNGIEVFPEQLEDHLVQMDIQSFNYGSYSSSEQEAGSM